MTFPTSELEPTRDVRITLPDPVPPADVERMWRTLTETLVKTRRHYPTAER